MGSDNEVRECVREITAETGRLGGAFHVVNELKFAKRHKLAIEIATQLFLKNRESQVLNILFSAILASGDTKQLTDFMPQVAIFAASSGFAYDTHLIATWLRALLLIRDQAEFWRVYTCLI